MFKNVLSAAVGVFGVSESKVNDFVWKRFRYSDHHQMTADLRMYPDKADVVLDSIPNDDARKLAKELWRNGYSVYDIVQEVAAKGYF